MNWKMALGATMVAVAVLYVCGDMLRVLVRNGLLLSFVREVMIPTVGFTALIVSGVSLYIAGKNERR